MLNGSCLCGRVAYQITGPLTDALNCHCAMCRKSHGAAFRSRATVQASDFAWTKGESHVTWYCSSPGNYRGFCEACGTPLLSRFDQTPDIYGLPLGALDDDPGIKPGAHCHVANKAPWFDITDSLPQYPDAFEGAETSLPHAVT
ncbi:GFA family protein [Achromobacter sp. EB05]|uniref:GFA family protein n=1 Tax=Achromobacter sp. EB05 TaxID=3142974 RepID=UPI003783BC7F